jgi:hypothetical protein
MKKKILAQVARAGGNFVRNNEKKSSENSRFGLSFSARIGYNPSRYPESI